MAVDARRSAVAGDGRSIRSVLFRTMAESRDVSYLGLLAIELLPRLFYYPSWFHGSIISNLAIEFL